MEYAYGLRRSGRIAILRRGDTHLHDARLVDPRRAHVFEDHTVQVAGHESLVDDSLIASQQTGEGRRLGIGFRIGGKGEFRPLIFV